MSNLSTSHLLKCIVQKDKYKQTLQYIKEVQLKNENVYTYINEALYEIIVTTNHLPTSKLYGLRFFKDLFLSAQFHLIDGLDEQIFKQLIKVCQFDKENKDLSKRGFSYFQQFEKRKKTNDSEKISFSYVLFSTQIVYVLGVWHALDQNNLQTDYAVIFEKLKKAKVPFPGNDKELKFFKPEEKYIFLKNYKQWVQKLPQIEQQCEQEEQKQNNGQKSKKSIKSRQKLPETNFQNQQKQKQKDELAEKKPFQSKDSNIVAEQSKTNKAETIKEQSKSKIQNQKIQKLREEKERKQKQLSFTKLQLERQVNKNKVYEQKLGSQQEQIKKLIDQQKHRQNTHSKNYIVLSQKHEQLETKYFGLEKEFVLLKNKIRESQLIVQKLTIQNQQQKQLIKKILGEKAEIQERFRKNEELNSRELQQSHQRIKRLEREIEQLNTIKKSYKRLMEEDEPVKVMQNLDQIDKKNDQHEKLGMRVKQLLNHIEQIVQFYTKQVIQLKQELKGLKDQKDQLEKHAQQKQISISKLKQLLQLKNRQINELEKSINRTVEESKHNQVKQLKHQDIPLEINLIEIKPELKRQNSMSDYLKAACVRQNNFVLKQQPQKSNNVSKQQNRHQGQLLKQHSLGKTEKLLDKLKQRKNRYSSGKTFHFSGNQNANSSHQADNSLSVKNSFRRSQSNYNFSCWKSQFKQHNQNLQSEAQNLFHKKSSTLLLQHVSNGKTKKSSASELPRQNIASTIIPYIDNYFTTNTSTCMQDTFLFKSLCLSPDERSKRPIYSDKTIEVKLFKKQLLPKQIYVLQIKNVAYTSIKVKAITCHEQFRVLGDKTRFINSNSLVQYQVQTRNKDLNLRYPIICLIVMQNQKNQLDLTYNIPLPLTLLEFTQFSPEIPQFCQINTIGLKKIKSQKFKLNKYLYSLDRALPFISFQSKSKTGDFSISKKSSSISWQGSLSHCFIQNIETYFKIFQVNEAIQMQFLFRDYDQVSQNFTKVIIQTLMFLLQ